MRVPKELTGEAADWWKRNAPLCEQLGTLTVYDRDAFILLANTWARLQAVEESNHIFVMLAKRYTELAEHFGLTRKSRKRLGIQEPNGEPEKDEFGL